MSQSIRRGKMWCCSGAGVRTAPVTVCALVRIAYASRDARAPHREPANDRLGAYSRPPLRHRTRYQTSLREKF